MSVLRAPFFLAVFLHKSCAVLGVMYAEHLAKAEVAAANRRGRGGIISSGGGDFTALLLLTKGPNGARSRSAIERSLFLSFNCR